MKKYILALMIAFVLHACNDDNDSTTVEEAPISVLAYMVAENDIENALRANIGTMFSGLSCLDKPATLLIYWDGNNSISGNDTPVILRYKYDGKEKVNGQSIRKRNNINIEDIISYADVVKIYPEQYSTNKEVMSQVLRDMVNLAPTNHIGLIAGSHASSWVPAKSSRAFGAEDGYSIQISDMAEAMESINRTFDFILFDACLMGSVEVCYDFRNVTNYQIVSVLEIPAYGFPYDLMLKDLYKGNKEGYVKACQTYIDYYNNENDKWGTVSLIDSKKMDGMATLIKQEISSHKDKLKNFDVSILQEYGRNAFKNCSFDVKQFVKVLNENIVPSNFEELLNETVIYTGCVEDENAHYKYKIDIENYSGLGLYIPCKGEYEWNNYFKVIDWYKAAGWENVSFDWYF